MAYLTEEIKMDEYKKPYYILFNAITDAIKMFSEDRAAEAMEILYISQIKAEEAFVSFNEEN